MTRDIDNFHDGYYCIFFFQTSLRI